MNGAAAGSRAAQFAPGAGTMLVSLFDVCGTVCALDAALISEVVRPRRITRVPHAPRFVRGVIDLRGNIVTVIDLGEKLGLGTLTRGEQSRLYIVRDRDGVAGLLTDHAADVIELQQDHLEPPPGNAGRSGHGFFTGMARAGDQLVVLLDPEAVLDDAARAEAP